MTNRQEELLPKITAWLQSHAPSFILDEGCDIPLYVTRDNGDVGSCTPGRVDIANAVLAVRKLNAQFGPLTACWDTCDEWTEIRINNTSQDLS